ncbi:MAG: alpha/beta hydrolase [Pseudomonadota bacterium]
MTFAIKMLALIMLWPSFIPQTQASTLPGETPIEFETRSGEVVEAFQGQLEVPSNWQVETEYRLTLRYVRFPQINGHGGAPIVYLAGGPGGSGIATARAQRFPLFMALREFGDVIAFDQRGTGESTSLPACTSDQIVDDNTRYSDEAYDALYRAAAEQCLTEWTDQGIRPQDWTTTQSVGDLNALRKHLGAEKISLWGISYGSHLALAAINAMDDRIDRVVLASVEGLDQTVKRPSRTDAYFQDLQQAINTREDLREQYPDIVRMMRRVQANLDDEPMRISVTPPEGMPYEFLLERRDIQQYTSMMIADPRFALRLLDLYRAIDAGLSEPVAELLANVNRHNVPIRFAVMPFFMDIASGIDPQARSAFDIESQTGLVGRYLNYPMPQLHDAVPELDLGTEFRTAPISDVPTLVLTGTLDGRTYPESQREAVAGLTKAEITIVENAGHNLFMSSPAVTERIQAFMRGQQGAHRIVVEDWES